MLASLRNGGNSKRKEFAPAGRKFFPLRVAAVSSKSCPFFIYKKHSDWPSLYVAPDKWAIKIVILPSSSSKTFAVDDR